MSRLILIQPSAYSKYPGMPMGLIHTASCFKQDHDVIAIDLVATPMNDKQLSELVQNEQPDCVLIGGTSPSQPEAYDIARIVKSIDLNIIVIKGGPHELFYPHRTARCEDIDFVLSGDGETGPELLRRIEKGEQPDKVFSGTIADLRETSLPDRQLLYPKNPPYYDFLDKPTAQLRMTRGCIFDCTYCSQGRFRKYSDDYLLSDLKKIEVEGFQAVYWDDALFTLDRKRLKKLLPIVAEFDFDMGCITRAGINTDLEILEIMRASGFKYIWFALESGDEEIRESFGRRDVGPVEVQEAVSNAWKAGLIPFVNIIIGSAQETVETIQRTIDALNFVRPFGVSVSVFTIYPGMEDCKETTYEKPINRDCRLMVFDEGYGGCILIAPGLAEEWYYRIKRQVENNGIKMLDFVDCKTPSMWELPPEPDAAIPSPELKGPVGSPAFGRG